MDTALVVTAGSLTAAGALALSLLFEYIPGIAPWYNGLDETKKRGIMALLVALIAVGAMAVKCSGVLPIEGVTCTSQGVGNLVLTYITVLGTGFAVNQGTYSITKKAHVD